jgi:hypothetical protein
MDELTQLQNRLEAVKRMMELFFMGSEKRLPARERGEISQSIRRFIPGQDAVLRFKHQNLMQRLLTLERYWERTLKAIEQGRYERDLFKADYRGRAKTTTRAAPTGTAKVPNRDDAEAAEAFLAALGQRGSDEMPSIGIRGVSKSKEGMPKIEQRGRQRQPKDESMPD